MSEFWTISKIFSIVVLIIMIIIYFTWALNQVDELSILFGLRTSHTVANDIGSLISSISGIPGNVNLQYNLAGGKSTSNNFKYDVTISNKIVCVGSYLRSRNSLTTDCFSHPYNVQTEVLDEKSNSVFSINNQESFCINFRKNIINVGEIEETQGINQETKIEIKKC